MSDSTTEAAPTPAAGPPGRAEELLEHYWKAGVSQQGQELRVAVLDLLAHDAAREAQLAAAQAEIERLTEVRDQWARDYNEVVDKLAALEARRVPDELRKLSEAATQGEWSAIPNEECIAGRVSETDYSYVSARESDGYSSEVVERMWGKDAALAASAVNWVRSLILSSEAPAAGPAQPHSPEGAPEVLAIGPATRQTQPVQACPATLAAAHESVTGGRDPKAPAPTEPASTDARKPSLPHEGDINPAEVILPCDVHLPPATRIRRGCRLSTLLTALDVRARQDGADYEKLATEFPTEPEAPAAGETDEPLSPDDQKMIDAAWEKHKAAGPQYACKRCGRNEFQALEQGCERGPCPMELQAPAAREVKSPSIAQAVRDIRAQQAPAPTEPASTDELRTALVDLISDASNLGCQYGMDEIDGDTFATRLTEMQTSELTVALNPRGTP